MIDWFGRQKEKELQKLETEEYKNKRKVYKNFQEKNILFSKLCGICTEEIDNYRSFHSGYDWQIPYSLDGTSIDSGPTQHSLNIMMLVLSRLLTDYDIVLKESDEIL